jgi:hypothetical protein
MTKKARYFWHRYDKDRGRGKQKRLADFSNNQPVPIKVGYVRLSVNNKENTDPIKSQKRLCLYTTLCCMQKVLDKQLPLSEFY